MLNFATVGTGWITHSFIKAAKYRKEFKLVGVYWGTEDKAKEIDDIYNDFHFYKDIDEMVKCHEIQVVYIV